ncbi:hypothetical protein AcV5_000183 [Taiwanofungus camphoratus]|nr:hypothetical protein AcV5_000183 [Antrodia cinnamomea]
MKVLLTGVTGVAGLAIYRAALADRTITHITVLTRRPIPSWAVLPADAAAKTEVVLHSDFLTYPPDLARRLAAHDACIWALGRSSVGMNEKEYTELTHGYVMAAIRAFNEGGVGERRTEESPFRFVLISGEGTDTTGKSSQMWARVKVCSPGMQARFYRLTITSVLYHNRAGRKTTSRNSVIPHIM